MELFRALAVLAEPPESPETTRIAELLELGPVGPAMAGEYGELFIMQLPPYASIYLGAEGMIGGDARDRVAGFWRALGQTPPAEPDHLPLLLAFYAQLAAWEEREREPARRTAWRNARQTFFWEHLLSWLPAYLCKVDEIASPVYRAWGALLRDVIIKEAALFENQAERISRPDARVVPGLADAREAGLAEFLQSLLAPARSGLIITRRDLSRAAGELRLGLRQGERNFMLRALLGQDPRAVLGWLAGEASSWVARHRRNELTYTAATGEWSRRADATARLLVELQLTVPEDTTDAAASR